MNKLYSVNYETGEPSDIGSAIGSRSERDNSIDSHRKPIYSSIKMIQISKGSKKNVLDLNPSKDKSTKIETNSHRHRSVTMRSNEGKGFVFLFNHLYLFSHKSYTPKQPNFHSLFPKLL